MPPSCASDSASVSPKRNAAAIAASTAAIATSTGVIPRPRISSVAAWRGCDQDDDRAERQQRERPARPGRRQRSPDCVPRGAAGLIGDNCARDQSHSSPRPARRAKRPAPHTRPSRGRSPTEDARSRRSLNRVSPALRRIRDAASTAIRGRPRRTEHQRGAGAGWAFLARSRAFSRSWIGARAASAGSTCRSRVSSSAMRVGSSAAFGESSTSRSSGTAQVSVRKSPLTSGRRAKLLDADADEDALGGGGRADEGSERG